MKLQPATRERLNRPGSRSSRDFELKSGRLPGQDRGARQAQRARRHGDPRVRGAPLDQFRVSTPGPERHPRSRGPQKASPARRSPSLARREFAAGLGPLLPVRGLRREEGREDGHAAGACRATWCGGRDGTVLTRMAPSVIKPTSLGQLARMFGFRLEGRGAGELRDLHDAAGRRSRARRSSCTSRSRSWPRSPAAGAAARARRSRRTAGGAAAGRPGASETGPSAALLGAPGEAAGAGASGPGRGPASSPERAGGGTRPRAGGSRPASRAGWSRRRRHLVEDPAARAASRATGPGSSP